MSSIVLVSYSQLSLNSVDFSISVSELLLNFSNPNICLCLQLNTVGNHFNPNSLSQTELYSCCTVASCSSFWICVPEAAISTKVTNASLYQ